MFSIKNEDLEVNILTGKRREGSGREPMVCSMLCIHCIESCPPVCMCVYVCVCAFKQCLLHWSHAFTNTLISLYYTI